MNRVLRAAGSGGSAPAWSHRVRASVFDLVPIWGWLRTTAGDTPAFGQAACRNAIKLAGWQTAHLGLLRVTGGISQGHAHTIGSALLWGAYLVCEVDTARWCCTTTPR